MSQIMKHRTEKIFAVLVTLTIFVTRFDMSKGLLMNGFLLFLGACLLILWRKQIPPISKDIKGYLKAIAIYYVCIIPSILFSDKPYISLLILCFLLFQYGCFAVIILLVRQREYLVGMLKAYLFFSGFDCMLTLIQLVTGYALDNRGYGFGGWLLSIADIFCMLLPITLVILMDPRFEKQLKQSAAFAMLGIITGLLSNKSRGAWLTELIVVPIAVFQYLKQNRKYLITFSLVLLSIVSYMATNPQYVQRIRSITNTTTDHSNTNRIWAWKSAKLMIQDYPIAGVGVGMFQDKYEQTYKFEQETQNMFHTHNNFIQVAAECGMIGVAGFLYFIWYFLYTSLKNYIKNNNPYDILVFTVFLAHICLFGQIDYTLWNGAGMHPIFLFLTAILLRLKETDNQCMLQEELN